MKVALRLCFILACCAASGSDLLAQQERHHYGLHYDLRLKAGKDRADAAITLDQRIKDNIWSMRFRINPARHTDFHGDGAVVADGHYLTWTPPETGGRLSFQVAVENRRPNGRYDAMMTRDWAIFRGDDLFPPARTEQHDDAEADATLHVQMPKGWSFVSPYRETADHTYEIEHEHRSFDRPTGWMAAGRLGVRRERIAGVRVVVAGPLGHGVRRLDMLALLNWTLPRARRLIPNMPERLLVVSAGDPMWRGGLSGPSSLFIHAERPLLSENGSSTLVHELVHVITRLDGERGGDWIVEGIAEYYSLKLLWRSGTLTDQRYKQAFRKLQEWAKQAERLDVEVAHGPITARSVGIMRDLDHEIYRKSNRQKSLDDVVGLLVAKQQKLSYDRFQQAVVEIMGERPESLNESRLGLTGSGD
jgi:hypothetical protein